MRLIILAHWCIIFASAQGELFRHQVAQYVKDLRAGDQRLVRPSPTAETTEMQSKLCLRGELLAAIELLCSTNEDPSLHQRAIDFLAICTTNNPRNRWLIGGDTCVAPALVKVVHAASVNKDAVKAEEEANHAAAAAEAIWILSFNHGPNHAALVKAGAVEALGGFIVSCGSKASSGFSFSCGHPRSVMWAAAALQNLAASYCATPDGRCVWQWSPDQLKPNTAPTIDAEAVRLRAINLDGLVDELHRLVCDWPGAKNRGEGQPWPAAATVAVSDNQPSIVQWAVAGALKNLALSPKAHEGILPAEPCLCKLSKSPDWLEASKSQAALFHLGKWPCEREHDQSAHGNEL